MDVTRNGQKYLLPQVGQRVTEELTAMCGGQSLSSMAVMQELWYLII